MRSRSGRLRSVASSIVTTGGATIRIEDYGLIGDLKSAALVGRNGSVDWLCLPKFDSASCFSALLGDERHGRWLLAPAGEVQASRRRYRPGTLVLENESETAEGSVRVIDLIDAVTKELGRDGFVSRYSTAKSDDGLPGDEGQFLACSFWLASALAANGRVAEARSLFERLVGLSNDLGLLAEEYGVKRHRQVGNFPQAFSHLTLIMAARAISAAEASTQKKAA